MGDVKTGLSMSIALCRFQIKIDSKTLKRKPMRKHIETFDMVE